MALPPPQNPRADFLARARACGLDAADALIMADLVRHAARRGFDAIETVARTAPDPRLINAIVVNSINILQCQMLDTLRAMGPIGAEILKQLEIRNAAADRAAGGGCAEPEPGD